MSNSSIKCDPSTIGNHSLYVMCWNWELMIDDDNYNDTEDGMSISGDIVSFVSKFIIYRLNLTRSYHTIYKNISSPDRWGDRRG